MTPACNHTLYCFIWIKPAVFMSLCKNTPLGLLACGHNRDACYVYWFLATAIKLFQVYTLAQFVTASVSLDELGAAVVALPTWRYVPPPPAPATSTPPCVCRFFSRSRMTLDAALPGVSGR